jgi:S1-C subfamily serine protease
MQQRSVFVGILVLATVLGHAAPASEEVTWLGVQLGRNHDRSLVGVPVYRVIEGSPADKAGLRARDRVLSVDGQAVQSNGELIKRVQSHDTGSWIGMTISRGDHERDLRVRLAARPENEKMKPRRGWIGLGAIALPPKLRLHFGAPQEAGVMISEVESGSPAESAGFELGDVVYEMDGRSVKMPAELKMLIAGAGVGNEVEFVLTRWGLEMELEATVERLPESAGRRR